MTAATYEIPIKGRISAQLVAAFAGMEATVRPADTVLLGHSIDQAALRNLLDRIQGLGLELIEVRRLPDAEAADAAAAAQAAAVAPAAQEPPAGAPSGETPSA